MQLNWLHYLSKMRRWEALWKNINIQQKICPGRNEYLLAFIKRIIMGKWFEG
jgi:hypothetical protein